MKTMKQIKDFTGLYPLSKTLRFELIPQGKTLDNIIGSGFLERDSHRADSYKAVKKIIDEFHKAFIEKALSECDIKYSSDDKLDSLEEYYFYYKAKKEEKRGKNLDTIQDKLRKQIADKFSKNDLYKRLFSKELIKEDLKAFVKDNASLQLIAEFDQFTTYFTGFHENRKNMYSAESKSTAIAYRLIHENLPKFIDNMGSFELIKNTEVAGNFNQLYSDMGMFLNVKDISEIFELKSFSDFMSQTQIDVYNAVLGGRTTGEGVKIKGLNEYINLYNQKQTERNKRLPKLKPLYKQILSDRNAISWLPEQFCSDNELLESIEKFYSEVKEYVFNKPETIGRSLPEILKNIKEYDLHKIYLRNDRSITDISNSMFGNWAILQTAVEAEYSHSNPIKTKESNEKYSERKSTYFKRFDSFSLGYINDCLSFLGNQYSLKTENYFGGIGLNGSDCDLIYKIEAMHSEIKELLSLDYPADKDLAHEKADVARIKAFLDSLKALQFFIKPLLGKGNESEKDEKFYAEFTEHWKVLDQLTPLYNKVRDYMTKKPYSEEKIKLNFDNSTLLDGWDVNKESDNTGIIMRKDGLFYLAIMNKKHNKVLREEFKELKEEYYEKMEYKLLPGPNKMLPKVFFSDSRIKEFNPSEQLLENYSQDTHKKGDNFNKQHCHQLIDFFKTSIMKHEDWKNFEFQFSDTSQYEDISGFYREVERQGYKISFRNIPASYISKLVEEGKIYLFQIYNKDFSAYSKGTPNMHTLYWKMVFDSENLKDVVYKLNGQAEIFYRKSSIKSENRIIHKANQPIENKNETNKKIKPASLFEYDIIKDRRYTIDKFLFHVPITLNFKSPGINNINAEVNKCLKNYSENFHIIGIDRGERHLLYLTLIDRKGRIIEQHSLNEILVTKGNNEYRTNYHELLDKREEARRKERESWKTIETIKELKEGYISQVVKKIAELMVKYNAIVVLEDLNMGFMRGRQKVEKQVYQKFEKMLIDKLNYLVEKNKPAEDTGGLLKALQLTGKFESFKTLGKQSGFLFYVPAWNTSKMDPVTGFTNLLDTRYENIEKAKTFFSKFKGIRFNGSKNYFEFELDYNDFTAKAEGTRTNWTVCTFGERVLTFRNPEKNSEWDSKEIILTAEFIKLFNDNSIDYQSPQLKEQIINKNEKDFFERLLNLLKLTLQMRNSITGSEIDYLVSPVAGRDGMFFDSRNASTELPQNADANGAYNIARKGLWILEQIKKSEDLSKLKLAISNKEWLAFAQDK